MKNYFLKVIFFTISTSIAYHAFSQDKISLNKKVVASSTENDNYSPEKAVDADTATMWSSSASYKQSLYIDLEKQYDISKVVLKWGDGWYPSVFDIKYSTDAVIWKNIMTYKSETNNNDIQTFDNLKIKARYIQFVGRGRGGKTGYRIADFAVFGK